MQPVGEQKPIGFSRLGVSRPLTWPEQTALIRALKHLGNREYELMHYTALLTGARMPTVLTLRWGAFTTPPNQLSDWLVELPCGPGTGVDTPGDVKGVTLAIPKELYEWLHEYAISDRAKARRAKSPLKQDPRNYLFLSNQGGAYYESKDDRDHPLVGAKLKRSSATGQNLRTFITEHVIPEVRKTIPGFHYQFNDLRATCGVNWAESIRKQDDSYAHYLWARERMGQRLWHTSLATTDQYFQYQGREAYPGPNVDT